MAEQEPLYDFPEPSQTSKFKGLHPRSRGSLRSISVLDRLILTVPVWLQLSINPATALHILQREPPGTFLVRNSRTSQKKVLCVRLADNSEPSFVQQFGIQEENSTFSLETSASSFPDLPRLVSFYLVSSDVLPFPLELPAAIARASSHKELESISHMGIEFWSSQLNVRGPRDAAKPRKDSIRKPDTAPTVPPPNVPPPLVPPTAPEVQPKPETEPDNQPTPSTKPQHPKEDSSSAALFNEFCPIKTRSPKELNYGSGIGALCFINPLFLQSLNAWSRRRMFKRSIKVRVSTESATLLSPPLAPPPPPPLMPKTKSKCKGKKQDTKEAKSSEAIASLQDKTAISLDQKANQTIENDYTELPSRTQEDIIGVIEDTVPLPTVKESLAEGLDYMHPSSVVNPSQSPSNFPYLSPKAQFKMPKSLSPHDSPSNSPSVSPYQSPTPSPKFTIPLSPFTSAMPLTKMNEDAYQVPASILKTDQQMSQTKDVVDENAKELGKKVELVQQMPTSFNNSSLSCQEGAAPPLMPKTKCKGKMQDIKEAKSIVATTSIIQDQNVNSRAQKAQTIEEDYAELPSRTQEDIIKVIHDTVPLPTVKESLAEDIDYMQPSSVVNPSHSPSNLPYLSPKTQFKMPKSLSPHDCPSNSPSVSPYQSPTPSPKLPIPLSPFTSAMPLTKMNEGAFQVLASILKTDQQMCQAKDVEAKKTEELGEKMYNDLVQQMNTASLNDKDSSLLSSQEAEESHSNVEQNSVSTS